MTEQNNLKNDELSSEALEAQLRQMPTPQPPPELKAKLLADIPSANPTPRLAYRLPLVRTAAAAAILMVVVGLFAWLTAGNGGASVVWASVAQRIKQVDYVHFYEISHQANRRAKIDLEGWHSQGRVVCIKSDGTKYVDDGTTQTVFDPNGYQTRKKPSEFIEFNNQPFLENMVLGWLDFDKEELLKTTPTHVGEDFLVYKLDPGKRIQEWAESVSITVGLNSLLPVQIKIYRKEPKDTYTLYVLDYEAPEKPADFFEAKQRAAQGEADVVFGGQEVVIKISDSPGVEALVVRLYEKEYENIGKLEVLDAAVIITDGFRRSFLRSIPWKPNELVKIGVGDKEWPDKKHRNINVRLLIKPGHKKEVYHLEVDCWLGHAYRGPRD